MQAKVHDLIKYRVLTYTYLILSDFTFNFWIILPPFFTKIHGDLEKLACSVVWFALLSLLACFLAWFALLAWLAFLYFTFLWLYILGFTCLLACFDCFTLLSLLWLLYAALQVEHQKLNQTTPYGAVWLSLWCSTYLLAWLDLACPWFA